MDEEGVSFLDEQTYFPGRKEAFLDRECTAQVVPPTDSEDKSSILVALTPAMPSRGGFLAVYFAATREYRMLSSRLSQGFVAQVGLR